MSAISSNELRPLDSRLRAVWRRSQLRAFGMGCLAFLCWASLLFLIVMAVDWLVDLPALARTVLLAVLVFVAVRSAWRCGWRRLRGFDATRMALQLEASRGGMESLLVSAVQLRGDESGAASGSASLRENTCRKANEAAAELHPHEVVPYRELTGPAGLFLLLTMPLVVLAFANGPFLAAGWQRIFMPWLAVAYPTYTQIELGQGDVVVQQGASVQLEGRVSGVVPREAMLMLRTGDGKPREIPLAIEDGQCRYAVPSVSRSFQYQIEAGDAESPWLLVQVIPSPKLSQVRVELEFPPYLQRETEIAESLTLTAPEGTKVRWTLTLDRPVQRGAFHRDGEPAVELAVSDDGRQVSFAAEAADSRGYYFSWVDKDHGFDFNSSRYFLQVATDQAPQVELTSPASHLNATLGRPVPLQVRTRDDHGIDMVKVVCRVNRRSEESTVVEAPLDADGACDIVWDYRKALPHLQVGDSVAISVEVSDHYPGGNGPHTVRSESRRITMLSKDEYLKQIVRMRDRLLTRLRTIYRQERAAHVTIQNLDRTASSFVQTCQLEAIRQEMVREQLKEIADKMQWLLDDLAANQMSDAPQGELLERLRETLVTIADGQVARAASQLRAETGPTARAGQGSGSDPVQASSSVNAAGRALGELVLLGGVESAQEVFARETRMMAQTQADLRWRTAICPDDARDWQRKLATRHEELADWTTQLIAALQKGIRYEKRPLAVLRLSRSVKAIQHGKVEATLREIGQRLEEGKTKEAAELQAAVVQAFLDGEFSVRLSGAYSTLMATRGRIEKIAEGQAALWKACAQSNGEAAETDADLIRQQELLRRELLILLLPSIPAPRSRLFDAAPSQPPAVDELLAAIESAMAATSRHLKAGEREAAVGVQAKAIGSLTELTAIVGRWSIELGLATQGLDTLVAASSDRMSVIEDLEAKAIGLLEKTDIASSEDKPVAGFVPTQQQLIDDLKGFNRELERLHQAAPDEDIPPLLNGLKVAEAALASGMKPLIANDSEQAIVLQEQAADALAEAYSIVVAQNERLTCLQDLLMFQRSVGFASRYMSDIVAEQRDLLTATEAAKESDVEGLLPVLGNLGRCMEDVAPLLDLVAGRLDVGTPLAFGKTDLEDAIGALEAGDMLDAIDAQDVAAESLAEVQGLVEDVRTQTGYVAEIVEFLHQATSEMASMQHQQKRLVESLRRVPGMASADRKKELAEVLRTQRTLLQQAERRADTLKTVTGMSEFNALPEEIRAVIGQLEAGDLEADEWEAALEQAELAGEIIAEQVDSLTGVIGVLHGLPAVEVTNQTAPELVRLIDVLAIASEHQGIKRRTHIASKEQLKELAKEQEDVASDCEELAERGESNALLSEGQEALAIAMSKFSTGKVDSIQTPQNLAAAKLRHFIVEQAVLLDTSVKYAPSEGDADDGGEGSDSESDFSAGFISDFVSGETPADKRTEWKVLGERNRAALNQNFARELPLEYRGLLKNYYERLSQ